MRLALCYPAYRNQIHAGHLFQLQHLHQVNEGRDGIDLCIVDTCFLDLARNMLLHAALRAGADWALLCDADTYSDKIRPVIHMINTGHQLQAAVIAAPVRLRGRDAHNAQIGDDRERYLTREEWGGKVMQVDRVGTAFMAINLHWLREHWPQQPWFESRTLPGEQPMKMSEDYEFCDRIRELGGRVLLDGRFEPVHAGLTSESAVYYQGAQVTRV